MMSDASKAIFLSYASQDAEAVRGIADALRAAGVEVWFDQNELVGGDAWDTKIRQQIAECALFVPVISANTQARLEGYFRLEWKLAAQRTHTMADEKTFLMPVVIDDTRDAAAKVPAEFKAVQWTKLPGGEAPEKFCARVKHVLAGARSGGEPIPPAGSSAGDQSRAVPRGRIRRRVPLAIGVAVAAGAIIAAAIMAWPQRREDRAAPRESAAALTEAQTLVAQARKIYEEGDELNRENLFLAEELVKRALERDPAEPSAWEFAAWLSYTMVWHSIDGSEARRETLARQAARAVKLAPESVSAQITYANARLTPGWASSLASREKAVQEVERDLVALERREPHNWQIRRALGTVYRFLKRTDESLAALRRALELSAGHPMASGDLINVLIRRGRHEEAEAILAAALARKPTGRLWAFDLFLKLRWQGNPTTALSTAESDAWPVWLTREDRGAFFVWLAYYWAGKPEQALAVARGVPREYLRDANFAGPRAVLTARAYERAGHTAAAQADWRTVVQVADRELTANPDELSALYWKAWALARLGETTTAHALCALIQQRAHNDQPVFLRGTHFSALLATAGLPDAAVRELISYDQTFTDGYAMTRAVLTLDPAYDSLRGDPRFQELLAKAPAPAVKSVTAIDKSVAVLPFANLSTEQDNAFFAEGVHDDVITNLQKIRDLKVISRTSVMAFRDASARQLARIATELGVAHIVEGSVRRVGNQVRVNAKLIMARTEESLWADSFDGDAGDVFALQATIAQRIATALKATLTPGEKILIERRPTVNLSAHEDYLRAKTQEETLTTTASREQFEQVIALYDQAVAKDPGFALAWMRLTILHSRMVFIARDTSPERRGRAETALRAAERLAPGAPETRLARGAFAFYVDRDWLRAQREINAAQVGLPNEEQLAFMAGAAHMRLGEWAEGVQSLERAITLSPRDSYIGTFTALIQLLCRRYERALELTERHGAWLPGDRAAQEYRMRARFALDGDRAAYLRSYAALAPRRNHPEESHNTLRVTLATGDYRMLSEQLAALRRTNPEDVAAGLLGGPVTLRQAMTAWLLGQRVSARQFAEEAIAALEARQPTARDLPTELMWAALAKAYAGRGDAAVADARRAVAQMTQLDALSAVSVRSSLGRVFLISGRTEEAFEVLRELMQLPADQTPNELRWDPFWSQLKSDPRFEETLRTAKTL